MKRISWFLGIMALALGCSPAQVEPRGGESGGSAGATTTLGSGGFERGNGGTGGFASSVVGTGGNAIASGGASAPSPAGVGGSKSGSGGSKVSGSGGGNPSGGGMVAGGSAGSKPGTGGVNSGTGGVASSNGGASGTGGTTAVPSTDCALGYKELPDGHGGLNVEQVCYTPDTGLDKTASLAAFQKTLYPLLRTNCSGCHNTENTSGSGAQAPIHSDVDVNLAHEYALTRMNFKSPADSKFVVRMAIDRHNCFGKSCKDAAAQMLTAVTAWADAVAPSLQPTPYLVPQGTTVSDAQVLQWIASDKANTSSADAPYIKYTSLHELQNAGSTADQLNWARAGISKALNSVSRWAPKIANPVDISDGKGMVYRFDTRDYWGYNKGVKKLLFGGSDDDIAFALDGKKDYLGNQISSSEESRTLGFTSTITQDPSFATLVWGRVVAGNIEGAIGNATLNPNIDGFKTDYVEASQLVYTLTRPDVYNSIMALPWYVTQLEDELGVDKSNGALSYQYVVTYQAITVDSRLYYRAKLKNGGYLWKTYDVFTGQLPSGSGSTIEGAYQAGTIRFPFWANPIPKFIPNPAGGGGTSNSYSFIATLNQYQGTSPPAACDAQPNFSNISGFYNCRYYTGDGGLQESAEEIIFSLPNGLQAYMFGGGFNQRRVDAFTNIVRDPRLALSNSDAQVVDNLDFGGVPDHRLNVGASCISCHTDGMNRGSNNLRDWLDENPNPTPTSQLSLAALKNPGQLPTGAHGVDGWINDDTVKAQVRQYYPPSSVIHAQLEADRRPYLTAISQIKNGMVAGPDKSLHVEPVVWTFEWAQKHYKYPQERSN